MANYNNNAKLITPSSQKKEEKQETAQQYQVITAYTPKELTDQLNELIASDYIVAEPQYQVVALPDGKREYSVFCVTIPQEVIRAMQQRSNLVPPHLM